MKIFQPKSDFNAESVVLHQYDKAINMLRWLGLMQSWHTSNVKEFWEGRSATLKRDDNGNVPKFSSVSELNEKVAQEYYEEVQSALVSEYNSDSVSDDRKEELKRTIDNLESLWNDVGATYTDDHIGEMFRFDNGSLVMKCVKSPEGIVRTLMTDAASDLSYQRDDNANTSTWYEVERNYTYVVWNGTEFVQQPRYDNAHVGGWFYNVMNIDTCNSFGLKLWAKMLGIMLPEYAKDEDMPFAEYYYNKVSIWRQFIRASFFRLMSNGSAYDIAKYFSMIFGRVRGGMIGITDGGLIGSTDPDDVYQVSDVMSITYNMTFEAVAWQEVFLNIGAPNQATEGIFPHPAAVLSKCFIGVKTDDYVDTRLGLNEHNLIANTGKDISDADTDSAIDIQARKDRNVEGQNLQNLNFYETDFDRYPQFSTEKEYRRGDVVHYVSAYGDDLYRFLSYHHGAWTENDVQRVSYRGNGGYFAEEDNLNYLGLNERIEETIDTAVSDADSDPMNVVVDGMVMGQNINNFDHGSLFGYDNEAGEVEEGSFLGLGDEDDHAIGEYMFPEFSPDVQYYANDKVIYEDKPYVFNQSHSGAWDATVVVELDPLNKYDRNVLNESGKTYTQKTTMLKDE